MNITAKVISCLKTHLQKHDVSYVVGVSGGVDSMVLLDSLLKGGYSFDACFVIHNQSPEEEAQKELIEKYCQENNIKLFIGDLGDLTIIKKASAEDIARTARYEYFGKIANERVVLLGHHMDDQTETVLFRMIRGTGVAGLRGIRDYRIHNSDNGYFIINRPFLKDLNKSDLYEYATKNNVPFIEDSTNTDDYFSRNFLRNKVIPIITSKFPHLNNSIKRLVDNANDATNAMNDIVNSLLDSYRIQNGYRILWDSLSCYEKRLFIIGVFKYTSSNKINNLETYITNNNCINKTIDDVTIIKENADSDTIFVIRT